MLGGKKTCSNCATRVPALEVLRVSLGHREINCAQCGQPFVFSDARKWLAIFAVVLVVFSPTGATVFLGIAVPKSIMLVLKYSLALLLFWLVNGREGN